MLHSQQNAIPHIPHIRTLREPQAPIDSAMLSRLRHELRGSLAALLTAVEVLDITADGPDAVHAREVVRRQARRLTVLVNDLTLSPSAGDATVLHPLRQSLPPVQPRSVLLVTREPAGGSLAASLIQNGHEVHVASDGIAGLRRLLELQPDLALLQVDLPGLTGLEVARHARAAGHAGSLVALLDVACADSVDTCIAASGFDNWMAQPGDASDLWARLDRRDAG